MKLSSQTEFLIVSLILATVESDQEQVEDPHPQATHEQPQRHRQSNQQESEAEEEEENQEIDRQIIQSVSAANGLLSRRALTAMTEPIDRPAIEQPPQSKAASPKKKVNPRKRWLEASSSDEDDNR
jgi:mannitol-specific phosphotransferase system IIBC component